VTKLIFPLTTILLDKGVIRRIYERRVRLALGQPPTPLQVEAANAYARVCALTSRIYITEQTSNVLVRRPPIFAAPLMAETRILKKGRYLRRWARRLKDFSFSPEDAMLLAYGSFGVDLHFQSVGVEAIITTDLKLASHYQAKFQEIENRFKDMIINLPEPYASLSLPDVITAGTVLL
jgi:hypothetical protein